MFPHHCKEVSVKTVDFELTDENIKSFLKGKRAYIRTRYYVFNSGNDWAVALVVKKQSNEVLQPINSVQILSLPRDTAFIEDSSLEVLSATSMGSLRESRGTKCVVVRGKAEHISFFIEEPAYELTVFDVVPPAPTKLLGLVRNALETDLQDRFVKYKVIEVNVNELAKGVNTRITMFPCRASGLTAGKKVLFLDETPDLSRDDLKEVTLVGCGLSARIFNAVYGQEPRLLSMCPLDLLKERGVEGPVLVKCCKVREGHEVDGRVGIVPWGARAPEVTAALRSILR
ncbi:MAG: DUF7714 family protein [Thermoplasmata archaeon]